MVVMTTCTDIRLVEHIVMVTVSKLLLPQVLIARRVDRQVQEVILLRNFNVKTLHIEFLS